MLQNVYENPYAWFIYKKKQPYRIFSLRFDRHDIDTAIIESAAKREEPYLVVVLGPEKVGKTALICRFLEKEFPLKHRATSEQTNFGTYTLSGVKVKLEILDTSGKNEVCIELIRIIDFILAHKFQRNT